MCGPINEGFGAFESRRLSKVDWSLLAMQESRSGTLRCPQARVHGVLLRKRQNPDNAHCHDVIPIWRQLVFRSTVLERASQGPSVLTFPPLPEGPTKLAAAPREEPLCLIARTIPELTCPANISHFQGYL